MYVAVIPAKRSNVEGIAKQYHETQPRRGARV